MEYRRRYDRRLVAWARSGILLPVVRGRFLALLLTVAAVLILLATLPGLPLTTRPVHAQPLPAWWDTDWDYRMAVQITEKSGSTLTDFQVNFVLGGTASFDYSKVEGASGEDLRFTTSGGTLCDYYIDSWNSSGTSSIWLEAASLAASGTTVFYMYYGNSSAGGSSSFDNTFTKNYGESGLVGLWHMDDGAGSTVIGSSAYANSGSIVSAVTWQGSDGGHWGSRSDVTFATGDHLDFAGDEDGVDVASTSGDELSDFSAMTVMCWMNHDAYDQYGAIVCKPYEEFETAPYTTWDLALGVAAQNQIGFSVTDTPGKTQAWAYSAASSISTAGGWYHIAGTWDGDDLQCYINGQASGNSVAKSCTIYENNEDVEIGHWSAGWLGVYDFNGQIDEARIYDRALTQAEINCYYERRKYSATEPTTSFGDSESVGYSCGAVTTSYKVLDASDSSVLCTITGTQVAAGFDISSCAGSTASVKAYAELTGGGTSTATLYDWELTWTDNNAPVVNAPIVWDTAGTPSAVTSMTPQVQYNAKVLITDNNTLDDLNTVKVTIFYDSDGAYSSEDVPATGNTQTAAILTWTNGGSPAWTVNPGSNTSWTIESDNCVAPLLTGTSGNFEFHFKPGKVATETTGSAKWHIYSEADDGTATGDNYSANMDMNWYGEVAGITSTTSFGTVGLGSEATISGTVSATFISNGAYDEQVKSEASWTGQTSAATLSLYIAGTDPGTAQFAMLADDDGTQDGAVQVLSAGYASIDDIGTQTGESGDTASNNHLWLWLGGVGIPDEEYQGAVYYKIADGS